MAKIKKRKLRWKPSGSPLVLGYKLYWSENGSVGYHSPFIDLGNVTEIVLPDDVPDFKAVRGPVERGIAAVNEMGNESDLSTPCQFNTPQAPERSRIETLDEGQASDLDAGPDRVTAVARAMPEADAAIDPRDDENDEVRQPAVLDDQTGTQRFSEMLIRGY